MAQVKPEAIVDHLDREFRRALAETIREVAPDVQFDEREAFRTFKRRVYRHCSIWEDVPDDAVKA